MRKQLLTAAFASIVAIASAAGAQVYVRVGPPPPRHEVMPPPPHEHPGWVWHQGYHRWDGHAYVWVPGSYVEPPYERARWIPGHWDSTPRGYIWVEGHWVR
jgi:hypothetical protein